MDHYPEALDLHVVVPDEDGEFVSHLHEDDGLTDAHQHGRYLRTAITLTRTRGRVRVASKTTGDGFPEFRRTRVTVVVRGCPLDKVDCNGASVGAHRGRFEFENRGEAFEFSFGV
jgi:alpha-glucosidase